MSDKPTLGSVAGEISGIVNGIHTGASIALKLGPRTSTSVAMERDYYQGALERILEQATRAEKVWAEYFRENT